MPPVTTALIVANVAIYLLQTVQPDIALPFALWPLAASAASGGQVSFHAWQLLTYGFLHGGFVHLLFNMFALYMFGSDIERLFGSRFYAAYYLGCVVSAAICHIVVTSFMGGPAVPMVGASGGIYGLLLAFGVYFPHRRVLLLFPPIPLPARVFVAAFAVLELFLGVTGTAAGVAHFAHLGGMLGGYLMILYRRHV